MPRSLQLCRASLLFILLCVFRVDVRAQSGPLLTIGTHDSVHSDILAESRDLYIHLPADGLREGVRYPVLYLLDGKVQLEGMAAVLNYYMYSHTPEMIVVAIAAGEHRTRDLTISAVETRNGAPVQESGGSEAFTRFMAEELIPYIDSKYPTTDYRTLVGHSYGGLFTIATLLRHPDLFANYIAMDPSLGWDDARIIDEAQVVLPSGDFSGKTLFMSIANEIPRFSDTLTIDDVETDTTEFSLGIRSELAFTRLAKDAGPNGLRFDWKYYERDLHGSVPLISMRDGLLFAFDWWELRSPSLYNDPSTPTERLVELIRARTERLTKHMGYPMAMEEELLDMLGYMAMGMEQMDKARAIFELAAETYPESAGIQDSLVEYWLSVDDPTRALEHALKAVALEDTSDRRAALASLQTSNQ